MTGREKKMECLCVLVVYFEMENVSLVNLIQSLSIAVQYDAIKQRVG